MGFVREVAEERIEALDGFERLHVVRVRSRDEFTARREGVVPVALSHPATVGELGEVSLGAPVGDAEGIRDVARGTGRLPEEGQQSQPLRRPGKKRDRPLGIHRADVLVGGL